MNSGTVLVIDDEPQIRKLLEINLESNGYTVLQAETGKQGIAMAATHTPDIILLDIGLPDKSGHELLKELRIWYSKPIIMLSVLNGEQDIVTALDNGASDYLTKPFRAGELLARIRSASRVVQTQNTTSKQAFDDIEIDFAARAVFKNGIAIKLTNTEYNLLALFARNEGRVLTHQFVLKEIWGVGYQKETQYLRVFVATLRKKIEDDHNAPKHLLTESGVGYRFV